MVEISKEFLSDVYIPTYIINLKKRAERKAHCIKEFENRSFFNVKFVEACLNPIGAVGLWSSFVKVTKAAKDADEDLIIICEDDHKFTSAYSDQVLLENIIAAANYDCDILLGGVGGFGAIIDTLKTGFLVNWFWCTQFVVLFKKSFERVLSYEFAQNDTADNAFSSMFEKKMVINPFISTQIDFGYSDVTSNNDKLRGLTNKIFLDAQQKANNLLKEFNR